MPLRLFCKLSERQLSWILLVCHRSMRCARGRYTTLSRPVDPRGPTVRAGKRVQRSAMQHLERVRRRRPAKRNLQISVDDRLHASRVSLEQYRKPQNRSFVGRAAMLFHPQRSTGFRIRHVRTAARNGRCQLACRYPASIIHCASPASAVDIAPGCR